jgi:hypothetical protein
MTTPAPDGFHVPYTGTVAEIEFGPVASDVISAIHRKPSVGDRSLDNVNKAAGRPDRPQT